MKQLFSPVSGYSQVPDDIKTKLIETAGASFAERGYDAVGIREICQNAGANVAAVNYHFGDKRGLYRACLEHAQTCRVADLDEVNWPESYTATDKLRAFIRRMLEEKLNSQRPEWHQELMLRELSRPSESCREFVEAYIRPSAKTLGVIMAELFPGREWDQQTWMIGFSIVGQVLFYQLQQPVIRVLMGEEGFQSLNVDVLTDHITRFCLAALGYGEPLLADAPRGEQVN
ncbi:CerR family C-terminal domain-containing protein [Lacipirellula sp.]|uniref:CerR family C-terminal domain-containing protein n=1 Tax=Lacipirellula sp. TaxID=2691419 RepID=UPI003D0F4E2D